MRRSIWTAVLVTVALLVTAGSLPRWSWDATLARTAAALGDGRAALEQAMARLSEIDWAGLSAGVSPPVAAGVAIAIALLLATAVLVRRFGSRSVAAAARYARRGRTTAWIARRTRLAQDAVRMLGRS